MQVKTRHTEDLPRYDSFFRYTSMVTHIFKSHSTAGSHTGAPRSEAMLWLEGRRALEVGAVIRGLRTSRQSK